MSEKRQRKLSPAMVYALSLVKDHESYEVMYFEPLDLNLNMRSLHALVDRGSLTRTYIQGGMRFDIVKDTSE